MRNYVAWLVAVWVWYAISGIAEVSAQEARSFEQLEVLVKPGDKVHVLGADGTLTKGRIESLTPALLRLATNGKIRDYAQGDTIEIKRKKADSLLNGALIGAATGAGLGLADWISAGGCDCSSGEIVGIVAVTSAMGAGIGIGIDALITRHKIVYRRPVQTAFSRVGVTPVFGSGRKGVAMRFSF